MTTTWKKLKVPATIGLFLLPLTLLLVLKTVTGLLAAIVLVLILIILLRPRSAYLIFLATIPAEGFDAIPGASYAKIVGLLLAFGLALRILLRRESFPRDDLFIFFFAFLVGGILTFFVATDISVSIKVYITYVSLLIFYLLTRYFLRNLKDFETSFNILIMANFVMVASVFFLTPGLQISLTDRLSGGMGDPNEYASFVLVLLPMTIYMAFEAEGLKKVLYWTGCGLLILLLVFSFSRGGILGFIGVLMTLVFYYGRKRIKQLVIILGLIGMVTVPMMPEDFWTRASTIIHPQREETVYHGKSIEARTHNYRAATKMFLDNPVAGVGIYNFRLHSTEYGGFPNVVHNMYLEILSGEGLVGFIPFVIILALSWRMLRVRINDPERLRNFMICLKASFVSLLITSSFLSADHKKILWFLLAVISSAYAVARAYRESQGTADRRYVRDGGEY